MHKLRKSRLKSSKISSKNDQRGSTLVEVIVAIFVMSFGVMALMLAQINSVNVSINSANQSEVTRAVQNYVEEMRAKSKISIKETEDSNGSKIISVNRDYSSFQTADCKTVLNVNIVNGSISSCSISADGTIEVKWGATASDSSFSYKLQAGQE